MLRSLSHCALLGVALTSIHSAQSLGRANDRPEAFVTRPIPAARGVGPTFKTREVLIRFKDGRGVQSLEAQSIEAESALTRMRSNEALSVHLYQVPEGEDVASLLRRYRNDERIDYIEPNGLYYTNEVPTDDFYDNWSGVASDLQKWAMDAGNINAESAWDVTTGRPDVVIAVVDTGIDLDHPDLVSNIWSNAGEIPGNGVDDDGNGFVDDVNGWDFFSNDSNPNPDLGDGFDNDGNGAADDGVFHGTFSASCAGASANDGGMAGASWNSSLMALKVFTDDGGASTFDIANAITYAANNGADIINMSLGGGFSTTIQNAVNFAHSQGLVQVASAGNSNSSSAQYPASLNFVISVGASDSGSVLGGGSGDIDGRASFSQYGPNAVDVVAPGALVVGASVNSVANGNAGSAGWRLSSGTSFSAPLVSGLAALVIARGLDVGANLTNDDVEAIIQNNTVDLPDDPNDSPNGGSTWDGNGLVDFRACVDAVGGGAPVNNPPTAVAGADQSGFVSDIFNFNGAGSSDPDGPLASYSWNFGDGNSASGVTASHSYGSAGVFVVSLTVSDGSLSDTDTLLVTVEDDPPTGGGLRLYMTNVNNISVPGIGTLRNEDVYVYNTSTGGYTWFFDGSDLGLASAAIDGLAFLPDGDMLFSLSAAFTIPGLVGGPGGSTTADDSDIIRFSPASTGSGTSGVLTFYFDGSDVALTSNGEDVDAISLDGSGNLIVSTTGGFSGSGASGADEDFFVFNATSLGASTSGSFSRLFDGSDVGMGGNSSADVTALHWAGPNTFYLSTLGNVVLSGFAFNDEDVFEFNATNTGNATSGSFAGFFDTSATGISTGEDTRGLHIE